MGCPAGCKTVRIDIPTSLNADDLNGFFTERWTSPNEPVLLRTDDRTTSD